MTFQCYLDDSGTSGLPIITMAGFLAPSHVWSGLEPTLDDILNRYKVPILHAKDFHGTKGAFKGWSRIKKRTFAKEIFSAAGRGPIYGLSITNRKADLTNYQNDSGRLQTMSPYGVCFATIMMKTLTDRKVGRAVQREGVAFLVESGNKNDAEIEQYFRKFSKAAAFKGSFQSIEFIPKHSCRAIQIADFFAFYSRRWIGEHDRFAGKFALPESPYLQIVKKNVPTWIYGGRGAPQHTDVHTDDVADVQELVVRSGSTTGR